MALNLARSGFALVAHDIDPAKLTPLRAVGAQVADSPERVAAGVERTICMVETTAQAESVIAGEQGIIRSVKPGHIVICMSTIDPFAAKRLAAELAKRGVQMLDAPVSGGTERAESGELSIIAGGDVATFDACGDLFKAMGTNLFHVGRARPGAGHEARQQHADPGQPRGGGRGAGAGREGRARSADDLRRGPRQHRHQLRVRARRARRSWPATSPRAARWTSPTRTRSWRPPFAKQLGVPLFLANVTQQVYQMARAAGLNKEDGLAVMKILEQLAGVQVGGRR